MAEEAVVEKIVEESVDPETGRTWEDIAGETGWVAPEEYDGHSKNPLSAQEFVERGRDTPSIRRKQYTELEKSHTRQGEEISDLKLRGSVLEQRLEAQDLRHQTEMDNRQRQAVEDGDVAAYDAVKKERETAQPVHNNYDQATRDFADRNSWYGVNPDMTDVAEGFSQRLAKSMPSLTPEQNLSRTEDHIKNTFAQNFKNPKRTEPAPVSPGQRVRPTSNAKTYEAMPDDSQVACDRAVHLKMSSKEDFVKNYWTIEGAKQ